MAGVIWTSLAIHDLKEIFEFIARDSPFYAEKIVDRLTQRTGQLEKFPFSGRTVPEFSDKTLRELTE